MSTVTKKAFAPLQLGIAAGTLYTVPANTRASIKKITVSNTDTVPRIVTFYLVPSGGTASAVNIITVSQTVNVNEARDLYEIEGHSLSAGDFIQGLADVAAKVSVHGTVVETTV